VKKFFGISAIEAIFSATVIVIEHDLDVIKNADYIIDLLVLEIKK